MKFPDWLPVVGDLKFRGQCPSEENEMVTLVNQLRKHYPTTLGAVLIHPFNEGVRHIHQARKQNAEGMTTGAADIIIPFHPTIVIEMKRRDHTKSQWQPKQLEYLEACSKLGCIVFVALGWEAAFNKIKEWKPNDN